MLKAKVRTTRERVTVVFVEKRWVKVQEKKEARAQGREGREGREGRGSRERQCVEDVSSQGLLW
jgi:hypothetical protein